MGPRRARAHPPPAPHGETCAGCSGGREVFYQGEVGERLVHGLGRRGGLIHLDDLAAHHSDWVSPLSLHYRGHTVYEMPPNTQGITALQAMRLLDGFDQPRMEWHSGQRIHFQIEAKKIAFADRDAYVRDPEFVDVPSRRCSPSSTSHSGASSSRRAARWRTSARAVLPARTPCTSAWPIATGTWSR